MKFFHVNFFVIKILEKMQLIFDRDRRPARFQLSDWYDGHRLKWCMKLGKHFVLIYSPCFINLGVVQLCIFVSLCKLLHMKTKSSVYNTHADFRSEISEKSSYDTRRVNRFICNILYMIPSSNSVLRSKGLVYIFSGRYRWRSLACLTPN